MTVHRTLTIRGVEEQLLSRVILSEKMELEMERTTLISEITEMKKTLEQLDINLLDKLSSVKVMFIKH